VKSTFICTKITAYGDVSGSHGGEYEDCLLGGCAVSSTEGIRKQGADEIG
jgi:hypothetical protein